MTEPRRLADGAAPAWGFLRSTYDAVASAYDDRFDDELGGKPRDRQLLDAFATAVEDPLLDLGCGPGHIGRYLHQRGRRVVGVDLSEAMAGRARSRLGSAVAADLRRLPIATASVGGLVAFYSLIHLPRPELTPTLRELRRVLRPQGRLLLSAHEGTGEIQLDQFLGADVRFVATLFQLDELEAACEAASLRVTGAERRATYPSESGTARLYVEAVRPALPAD